MNNNVKFFRREKRRRQDHLGPRVGVARESIDAIENGRFLPSIKLAYSVAAALEQYVLEVSPPQAPSPKSSPCTRVPGQMIHTALTRGVSIH